MMSSFLPITYNPEEMFSAHAAGELNQAVEAARMLRSARLDRAKSIAKLEENERGIGINPPASGGQCCNQVPWKCRTIGKKTEPIICR